MDTTLDIIDLTKQYGSTVALSNFSYKFTAGIYGLLGANGAGKSTLFKLLTDTISRDNGKILWNNKDIISLGRAFRSVLGYMPQQQGYYKEMSIKEFLKYMGRLKGIPYPLLNNQIDELLSIVDLINVANRKMDHLSGGMRQRALLAQALLGNPQILILDEPTAGVDPQERIRIRNHIASIAKDRIVLLATHIVSDIECISNQVLLMNKGKLVLSGTPKELMDSLQGKVAERICTRDELDTYQAHLTKGTLSHRQDGYVLRIVGEDIPPSFHLVDHDISLEEAYLYYCT